MATDSKIDRRDDRNGGPINPNEGEHKYGDVEFADRTNKKYPIDMPEHVGLRGVTASVARINHKDNAAKYDADEVNVIKNRIRKAAKKHEVSIENE